MIREKIRKLMVMPALCFLGMNMAAGQEWATVPAVGISTGIGIKDTPIACGGTIYSSNGSFLWMATALNGKTFSAVARKMPAGTVFSEAGIWEIHKSTVCGTKMSSGPYNKAEQGFTLSFTPDAEADYFLVLKASGGGIYYSEKIYVKPSSCSSSSSLAAPAFSSTPDVGQALFKLTTWDPTAAFCRLQIGPDGAPFSEFQGMYCDANNPDGGSLNLNKQYTVAQAQAGITATGLPAGNYQAAIRVGIESGGKSKYVLKKFTVSPETVTCPKPSGKSMGGHSITTTSATLNGFVSANGGDCDTKYFFEYDTDPDFSTSQKTEEQTMPNAQVNRSAEAPITGLTPHTQYYYRLFVSATDGSAPIEGERLQASFWTSMPIPKLLPSTDIVCDAFTANWEPVEGANEYWVNWSRDGGATWWNYTVLRNGETSLRIDKNMSMNTEYKIYIRASSSISNQSSRDSEIMSTTTQTVTSSISQNIFNFAAISAGPQKMTITATEGLTWKISEEYRLTFSAKTGTGTQTIDIDVEANPYTAPRSLYVNLYPKCGPTIQVEVKQAAAAPCAATLGAQTFDPITQKINTKFTTGCPADIYFEYGKVKGGPYTLYNVKQRVAATDTEVFMELGLEYGATYFGRSVIVFDGKTIYGAEITFTAPAAPSTTIKQTLTLPANEWILLGIGVNATDMTTATLFKGMTGLVVKSNTEVFDSSLPAALNMAKLTAGKAYFFKSATAQTIVIEGQAIDSALPIDLAQDWNLIAFTGTAPVDTRKSFGTDITAILVVKNDKEVFETALPDIINSLKTLTPGSGYFVKASKPITGFVFQK